MTEETAFRAADSPLIPSLGAMEVPLLYSVIQSGGGSGAACASAAPREVRRGGEESPERHAWRSTTKAGSREPMALPIVPSFRAVEVRWYVRAKNRLNEVVN
jgi:hypothetical protein